ncbi:MAG: radical SAM protein, partial [Candidatus Omnitrophota bacterium]|nr:radical SAM protein [Candidatus Omnitrophota bacterium]
EMFPAFDVGVLGEGEETLGELIKALESGEDINGVKGIVFRSAEGIKLNGPRPFIENMDKLPFPAWDLLPSLAKSYRPAVINYKRLPATSLVTSRGCPGNCAFCDTKVFGTRYRIHSAGYVLKMIDHLKDNHGINDICFYDDVFTIFKQRLIDICGGLKEKRHKISWSCQARVNSVDYETLKMMKESGCWKVSFGIESGSDDILRLMNKHIVADRSKKAIEDAKRAGLEVEGYFILGFFGETKETLEKTKKFIAESSLDTILLSYFLPFPGSPAYAHIKEYGRFEEDWRKMNVFDKPQFIPAGISAEDMVDAQNEIYRNFYFRPKMFAKYAWKMIRNPGSALRMAKSSIGLTNFVFKNG